MIRYAQSTALKSKDKTIYFVRHGQSVQNVMPIFQGTTSELSQKGHAQVNDMASRVSEMAFDALIASPLTRTVQTAEAIARMTNNKIEFSDLFIEVRKPSIVADKPYDDKNADAVWRSWQKSLHTAGLRVEDGENYDDLIARADQALYYLLHRSEQSIIVVTHGHFLRIIIARVLLGQSLSGELLGTIHKNLVTENTGITVIRHKTNSDKNNHWQMLTYNDYAHLRD